MLPVETLETVLVSLSRPDLESAQLTNRQFRDVIGNEAFSSQAALRLISSLQLASDVVFDDLAGARPEPYALNDDLLRFVRNACIERLHVNAGLHAAIDWYLTHREQIVVIGMSVRLPFASDEHHRSFFHEASDFPWSCFSVQDADNTRRTHIPLTSPTLRSCGKLGLYGHRVGHNALRVSATDLFDWINQTSHRRRVIQLRCDCVFFDDDEDNLLSRLRTMREEFRHASVANSYEISFEDLPWSVLSRKDEFECRACNRHTMEYFEIAVTCPTTCPALIVRRRSLF
ncbi:hypothetical protein AAVH_36291 [Aphelenchoides avenae]|nr:hypothetical protein AAVH_36291 [Aphelenchus avenae]